MSRISLAVLAGLAICTTAGAAACLAMLSLNLSSLPAIRATAIAAAALQGTLLILLSWLISAHIMVKIRQLSRPYTGVALALGVLASLTSLAAAALTLIWMETSTSYDDHVHSNRSSKVIAASVMLALAVTSQILFMTIHFAQLHYGKSGLRHLFAPREASPWSPATYVKSIRYSQTLPRKSDSEESESFGLKETPPSLRNKFVQASPLKLAFPQAVRHTHSRTRLLHAKDSAQSLAIDTATHPNATQESFDTWDTSSVDAQNRQAVMEACTSPITSPYNLEPIPGSPRASINPEDMMFFAPPRPILKRSRSHSPATGRPSLRGRAPANPNELHIHPLFRSDSPSTPPILTPGTRVVAAPDAGQILFHRVPSRPLPRVRSGSLPTMSRSPFAHDLDLDNVEEEVYNKQDVRDQERKMTPPVPEWVLNSKVPPPIPRKSASRSSLRVSTTSSLRVSTTSSLRVSSA
ncbi:hypothetical protein ISF_03638 [Cordyceps fumosorosea ARSEF 2679]|uniref:UV excision repair protein (RadW) n=1 Tax=Cordyceps fumosorosea (strain ARSEF 2679) TaxID=1081104 RepID=A0A162JDS2_CORFA|nr:hypothetical protein ISF_03638 [Cordyceps fumosorosea ARSEF 2679]OAA67462.1 hypothetical protein ISF_03638 [Cordyceps fumosorosea ARSEF 2679]